MSITCAAETFLQTCTPIFRTAVVTLYLADSLLRLRPQLYVTITVTVTIIMLQVVYVTLVFHVTRVFVVAF